MAMNQDVVINYVDQADLLVLRLPGQAAEVKGSTAILPFGEEDGVPATSLILHVGYDEDTDAITGELVGLEIPFFSTFYPTLSVALGRRIQRAMPARSFDGRNLTIRVDDVDPTALDEDLRNDKVTRNFIVDVKSWLDDFYQRVQLYKARHEVPPGVEDISERRPSLRVTMSLLAESSDRDKASP